MVVAVTHERRTPTHDVENIIQTDSLTRTERLCIRQNGPDVLIPCDGIDIVSLEPDDGARSGGR